MQGSRFRGFKVQAATFGVQGLGVTAWHLKEAWKLSHTVEGLSFQLQG